jgi:MFS family permease
MIVCDLVRGALTLSLPIGYATGHLSLTWFCVTAFAGGTAFVFFSVAEVSSLSSVVGPSRLVRASSVSEVAESTASLVGPGLGGLLISLGRTPLVGGALALLVDGASFLVSMFSLLFVRTPLHSVQNPRDRGTVWKELRQGQRYVWTHPTIRTLMLIAAGLNMLFSPVYLAVILRARNDMGASPTMVGLVFSLGAAGGLLGGLLSAWLTPKLKAGTLIMGALGAWALAMPLVALANTPWLLMGAWGLVTFISPQFDVPQRSYRLSLVPQELQGRVNSSFRVVAWGVQPAAIAVGGVLLSEFGARPLLWAIAAGMLLVALGGLLSGLRHAELPSKATT